MSTSFSERVSLMEPQTKPVFSSMEVTIRLAASVPREDCWRNMTVCRLIGINSKNA